MEELRSTQVLEREILEDARKKAHRILKSSDEALEAQELGWEKKTQDSLESIRKVYAERLEKNSGEIFARLPLDKRRLRSETAESFVGKAMDAFIRSLKRETLLSVLEHSLAEQLKTCESCDLCAGTEIGYSGMSASEAKELLKKVLRSLGPEAGDRFNALEFKEDPFAHEFPSIVINNNAFKISASVEAAAEALLKEKRAELAAALLGEGVLND